MTFAIIKRIIPVPEPAFDEAAARIAIIDGMRNDTVLGLHGAVEVSGAKNGAQVAGIFAELVSEIEMLSNLADDLLRQNKTQVQIIAGVQAASVNFDANDVKAMKIELYGSLALWKAAVQAV